MCVCGWTRAQVVVQCHGSAGQAVGLAGPPPLRMTLFISLQTQIGLLASESGQGRSAASLWLSFMRGSGASSNIHVQTSLSDPLLSKALRLG